MFRIFSARGRRRESGATGRWGVGFLIENPRRGGGFPGGGREGVCREFFGGGELNFFFGAEMPAKCKTSDFEGSHPKFGVNFASQIWGVRGGSV